MSNWKSYTMSPVKAIDRQLERLMLAMPHNGNEPERTWLLEKIDKLQNKLIELADKG